MINYKLPHKNMTGISVATAAISFNPNLFKTYQNHVILPKHTQQSFSQGRVFFLFNYTDRN